MLAHIPMNQMSLANKAALQSFHDAIRRRQKPETTRLKTLCARNINTIARLRHGMLAPNILKGKQCENERQNAIVSEHKEWPTPIEKRG